MLRFEEHPRAYVYPTIDDLDDSVLDQQRVLMRVDFNVPLDGDTITDDARIRAALPSIRRVIERGGIPILASHLGRPKGQIKESLRMTPVAERLAELLECDVVYADDCVGPGIEKIASELKHGQVMLLENLRFHPEEKMGDREFARQLATLGSVYINDAFGTSHRAHASMVAVPELFRPNYRAAGYLIQKELKFLGSSLSEPKKPFVAILGGAKVSDKIGVILALCSKASMILVGGAMAYTLLKAHGSQVGSSLVEDDKILKAREILDLVKSSRAKILLPIDHVIAPSMEDEDKALRTFGDIEPGWAGFDIGPETVKLYAEQIESAKTVFWNGPMGVFERGAYAAGTRGVAQALGRCQGVTIVGGGDSAAAIRTFGLEDSVDHISTGGGASLEFVEGKELPGIAVLAL